MTRRSQAALLFLTLLCLPVCLHSGPGSTARSKHQQRRHALPLRPVRRSGGKVSSHCEGRPKESVPAQVGLIHALLRAQEVDRSAKPPPSPRSPVQPNSAPLVTAMADVQFRLGEMPEAERSYLKAQSLAPDDPAPDLGLARIYRAYSLYRRAFDQTEPRPPACAERPCGAAHVAGHAASAGTDCGHRDLPGQPAPRRCGRRRLRCAVISNSSKPRRTSRCMPAAWSAKSRKPIRSCWRCDPPHRG